MNEERLLLSFEEITEQDLPELTKVMTRAFDDDSQKHRGLERGGPEGYDNGSQGEIIGGIIVWILEEGHNILGTIFVDPAFQDQGVGTQTWQFIEAAYPETLSWRLGTPEWATKNFHFYEKKCGFQCVESDPLIPEPEGTIIYRKEMAQPTPGVADPSIPDKGAPA
jgi:GNAT superfamily N-acetyltransferase